MRDSLKVAAAIFASLAALFALAYLGLNFDRFFAPRQEALRNQVFHESQAYNDGMLRDLENMQMQYNDATPAGKDALRAIALHRFSIYPQDKLPANLLAFYSQLKDGQ